MFEPLESRRLFSTVAVVAPVSVVEPADGTTAAATFTATLAEAAGADVTIAYATVNRTAKAGQAYTAASGSVTIPAGSTSATFTVPVLGNDVSTGPQTFAVRLKGSAGVKVNATAVATIIDSTPLPVATVSDVDVSEPAAKARSAASVTVDLANPSSKPVSVTVRTVNDTAVAGTDYVAATRTVVVKPFQTTATVALKVIGDATAAGDDLVFDVDVAKVKNGTADAANPFGRAVIRAADVTRPTVTVSSPTVVEGNAAVFAVSLSAASAYPVSFRYATVPGTATDITATDGIVTIPAGSTSATVTVPTAADGSLATAGQFALALSSPANADLATATATGTVDALPALTVADATTTVTDTGAAQTLTFAVTLSAASVDAVTVDYATADGTALAGTNYTATDGTLTFAPGQTTATVAVTILGNTAVGSTQTFSLALSDPTGATVATPVATAAIVNGTTGAATLSVAPVTVRVGTAGTADLAFTVTLSAAQASAVTVDYATADGTAVAGTDYTATAGTLTLPAGTTTGTVTVPVQAAATTTAGSTQTLTLVLSTPTGAALGTSSATGTIVDDDDGSAGATPTLSVAASTATVGTSGTATVAFAVTLSAAQASAVTVDYSTADGTAVAGTDYTATAGTLTIAAGATTGTVDVPVQAGATTAQSSKTFTLALSTPSGAALGTASATGTIVDDDVAGTTTPSLSVAPATVTVGTSGTGTLAFTVTLSAPQASAVTVHYATANGTAVAGTNYTATSGTLTIAAGSTNGTVDVPVVGAATTAESTTALTLALSSASGATLGTATATGTIIDDNVSSSGGSGTSTDLSDNLSQTTDSTEAATGSNDLAASFATGTSAVSVTSVTIPLAVTSGGAVTVAIYTDGGLEPGTLVGTLTSPSSYSTTGANATFTGSVALSASTTYWVVLKATSGTANWSWTDSTTGTGTGFNGEWATSSDGGTTWFSDDDYPLQMQVLAT